MATLFTRPYERIGSATDGVDVDGDAFYICGKIKIELRSLRETLELRREA